MSDYLDRIVARTQATEAPVPASAPAAGADPLEAEALDGPDAVDALEAEGEPIAGATTSIVGGSSAAGARDAARPERAATFEPALPMPLGFDREFDVGATSLVQEDAAAGLVSAGQAADASARGTASDRPRSDSRFGRAEALISPSTESGLVAPIEPSQLAVPQPEEFVDDAGLGSGKPPEISGLATPPAAAPGALAFAPAPVPVGFAESAVVVPRITIGRITVQVTILPERPESPVTRPVARRAAPPAVPALAPLRLRLGLGQM
jgi:hypothetical protein